MEKLLIINTRSDYARRLITLLSNDFTLKIAKNASELQEIFKKEYFDAVICGEEVQGFSKIDEFLSFIQSQNVASPIVFFVPSISYQESLDFIKLGAHDFISTAVRDEELIWALKKIILRYKNLLSYLPGKSERAGNQGGEYSFANIIAKSKVMLSIFDTIKKISDYKTTILISGESGTGKELIARAIHYSSSRKDQPFITINCGAIPENLLESELFGHVKGSFTGAHRTKKGLFEEANNGTLFLDEVGELPLLLQVKILRALQEEEIRRIGDNSSIKVNVRIIAASLKDLHEEVERGGFREDLFYRLNVLPIPLPPLRDRPEDIETLVLFFIQKFNNKLNMQISGITPEALEILMKHTWPGNVRELENTIERAMVLTTSNKIKLENIPDTIRDRRRSSKITTSFDELSIKKATKNIEVELIKKALAKTQGNRTQAAKILEISHRALIYKIQDYKLENFEG